ncbi:hypothetical protein [Arthrobacter sp. CAN_C5]|uniref:hypothetical protein n=1 Tax=Arthrobacter sp. CAN_C5 TaxID=2760706 RepID=UPI001AE636A7|nr:hypothetical protein [Arthrobacter sp. CAN_C5]MBP2216876.1 tRNA A37 N6-isopentenylltransferase MiaA [Arthrobacter sp. CAN_C5]
MSTTEFTPMITDLTTERLVLRRMQGEDSHAIRELWAERDPRVPRRIDRQGTSTVEQMEEVFKMVTTKAPKDVAESSGVTNQKPAQWRAFTSNRRHHGHDDDAVLHRPKVL